MVNRWVLVWAVVVSLSALGCGSGGGNVDAGADSSGLCEDERDCSDGVFCNGTETCSPDAVNADERGCAPATASPCADGLSCREVARQCVTNCGEDPDADDDGHDAIACGGDDCDDQDELAFPGNAEVCDALGHDEDCNPETLAGASEDDVDEDGFTSSACCNTQPTGLVLCGRDCDDDAIGITPTSPEICDGLDNNCNGVLDFPGEDNDNDGHADCVTLPVELRDCNDLDNSIYPGAAELCDGLDNDCNASTPRDDIDGDGFAAIGDTCLDSTLPRTDCDDDEPLVSPDETERCDGLDNDCDDDTDEEPSASATCPSFAGTAVSCVSPSCQVSSCPTSFDDCNESATDGCEIDLRTTLSHCGTCGNACHHTCSDLACDEIVTVQVAELGYDATACGLRDSGRVSCWGARHALGDGSGSDRAFPGEVSRIDDAVQLSMGAWHGCVLRAGGALLCWGDNSYGAIGDGTLSPRATPVDVSDIKGVVHVSAAALFTCAVRATGAVLCWGHSDAGQAGPGTSTPSAIPGLTNATFVSGGARHACVVKQDQTVWCWGSGAVGQLGQGMNATSTTPVQVSGLTGAQMLDATENRTCALRGTGAVVCWGQGPLGDGITDNANVPRTVAGGHVARSVTVGGQHACLVETDGDLWCWGENFNGQVGDGTTEQRLAPVRVAVGVESAEAGLNGTCALFETGQVRCWGSGGRGQLGNGSTLDRSSPVVICPLGGCP